MAKRSSKVVQKEIQLFAKTRIKAAGIRGQPALSEDQRSSWTEFIFFFFFRGETFIHTKRSNELAEYEKEKKEEDKGGRESVSYETLARVTLPFTL